MRVVDGEGKDVTHDGIQMGEIIMRGNTIIDGYWGLPEETSKTVVDGWLYSGDIATISEDGYITIVDRKKDIIISGVREHRICGKWKMSSPHILRLRK